jgi:hypothetical protein
MKNYLTNLVMILFFLSMTSCSKKQQEIEFDFLFEKVENFENKKNIKWIVVLPGLGCKGCIQEAEEFMRNNVSAKEVLFVLTKVESIKLLQQKIGINIKEHDNIYIDKSNYFDIPTDNTIYPLILELENNKMINYEFQSPKNGMAFAKFSEKLKTN